MIDEKAMLHAGFRDFHENASLSKPILGGKPTFYHGHRVRIIPIIL
jgi:hypothetical protein